jgi:hypothetical protein
MQILSLFLFICDFLPYISCMPTTAVSSLKNKLGSVRNIWVVVHLKAVSNLRDSEEEYGKILSESPRTEPVIEPQISRNSKQDGTHPQNYVG